MHCCIWGLRLAYARVCGCICTRGMHTIQYTGCLEHSLVYALLHMGPAPCICKRMRLHMHTRHAYHSVYRLLPAFPGVCTAAYGPWVVHMPAYELHMHARHAYHSVCRLLGAFLTVCTAAYGPWVLHKPAYEAAYAHMACIPSSMQVAGSIPYCMHRCIWALGSCICQHMKLHMHTQYAYHLVCRLLGAFLTVCTAAYGPWGPAYASI
jgi:hypothetical protein